MNRYSSILATANHDKVTSLTYLKQIAKKPRYETYVTMGFFLNKTCIGYGSLYIYNGYPNSVYTSGTKIYDEFRKKGHGIKLYLSLIKHAKKLGASRIYSDDSLNDFSEKMWSEKLPKYFSICKVMSGSTYYCNCCKKKHRHFHRYFIELGK